MTNATAPSTTTQVYQVYIRATPEAIWDAITKPEWTQRYGYRGINEYELRPGGAFRGRATPELQAVGMPEVVVDGEVIEVDPPRRLVQTWRFLWDDEVKAEGPTRVTFEIEPAVLAPGQAPGETGITKLTVTHEAENAPRTAAMLAGEVEGAGGGWPFVFSDLKTLLESGESL